MLHSFRKHSITWNEIKKYIDTILRVAFMRLASPWKEFSLSNSWEITTIWELVAIMALSPYYYGIRLHKTWMEPSNMHQNYMLSLFVIVVGLASLELPLVLHRCSNLQGWLAHISNLMKYYECLVMCNQGGKHYSCVESMDATYHPVDDDKSFH